MIIQYRFNLTTTKKENLRFVLNDNGIHMTRPLTHKCEVSSHTFLFSLSIGTNKHDIYVSLL